MPCRNGLGIELMQSLPDLCGIHLHRTTPLVWVSVRGRASCGASHAEWSTTSVSSAHRPVPLPFILGQLLMRSTRGSGSSCDNNIGSRKYCATKLREVTFLPREVTFPKKLHPPKITRS